jgi:epsilon-lactone hydrolase
MRFPMRSIVALGAAMFIAKAHAQVEPYTDSEGVLQIPATSLPQSSLLSSETRAVLDKLRKQDALDTAPSASHCGEVTGDDLETARATRTCLAESFYKSAFYREVLRPYEVSVTREVMNGVQTEVFVPKGGVVAANAKRVLINVHGGGFMGGARTASHTESIPIAAVGRIKVVSVDYRQGPEYTYPAATDDVEAVYRALLKNHDPKQIGLYGCSAGGLLTAQTVARVVTRDVPVPGAVGMFCEGAAAWTKGDSRQIFPLWRSYVHPYFKSVSLSGILCN